MGAKNDLLYVLGVFRVAFYLGNIDGKKIYIVSGKTVNEEVRSGSLKASFAKQRERSCFSKNVDYIWKTTRLFERFYAVRHD